MNNLVVVVQIGTHHMFKESPSLQYIAAYLRQQGVKVTIVFANSVASAVKQTIELKPGIVGVSGFSPKSSYESFGMTIKKRSPIMRLVVGGYDVTGRAAEREQNEGPLDTWVLGFGEKALWQLCQIQGKWPRMFRVQNLPFGELPWPDRLAEKIRESRCYQIVSPPPSRQSGVAFVSWSRGCSGACSFCATRSMCRGIVDWRSPQDVVNEIVVLVHRYRANLVWFCDETINTEPERLKELCDRLIAAKLPQEVRLMAGVTAKNLGHGLLGLMRKAGFIQLGIGVESGVEGIRYQLKDSQAGSDEELAAFAVDCDEVGIISVGFTLLGLPWDTSESIEESLGRVRNLGFDQLRLARVQAFPGTELRSRYREQVNDRTLFFDIGISDNQLEKLRRQFLRDFYKSQGYTRRILHKTGRHHELEDAFGEGIPYLRPE